jgi:hypothetical protein
MIIAAVYKTRTDFPEHKKAVGEELAPTAPLIKRNSADYAWPLRSSLPGVAPVHLPSRKVSTPLTTIEW